ncbi:hypothetical protein PoB_002456100 [Plakobranchus ocellatus]|uniref:Uncharacterized protein n=1 Tax=Plakobranchus ocellatus TaxID=259542 RepID=A0AAV3ZQ42_9GAST|nr:hypothetical protein PoB_002456100 [Plakobranchus ocellatus]
MTLGYTRVLFLVRSVAGEGSFVVPWMRSPWATSTDASDAQQCGVGRAAISSIVPWKHGTRNGVRSSPQQGDLSFLGPPSDQGAGGGVRTRDRRVPSNIRADSLTTEPPRPQIIKERVFFLLVYSLSNTGGCQVYGSRQARASVTRVILDPPTEESMLISGWIL